MTSIYARTAAALLAVAFLLPSGAVSSQTFPDPATVESLRSLRSLKCEFPWYASADFDRDAPSVKTASSQDLQFNIDGIDLREGAARLIGNAGADDLVALAGSQTLTFIERVPTGAVNVTAVYAWRDARGRFKAVHSRHTAIGGPSPSQNYGYCAVWQ